MQLVPLRRGQELGPAEMEAIIASVGRTPRLRTTLYGKIIHHTDPFFNLPVRHLYKTRRRRRRTHSLDTVSKAPLTANV